MVTHDLLIYAVRRIRIPHAMKFGMVLGLVVFEFVELARN